MTTHTHTVSTSTLRAGDVLLAHGGRVVASTERNMANLGAYLVTFTDGSWNYYGDRDAHAIGRAPSVEFAGWSTPGVAL